MTTEATVGQMEPALERARRVFGKLVAEAGLLDASIRITARTLSTEEAIGKPVYDDLPILRGKEVMIEAEFQGAKGHAFTSAPWPWEGSIRDLLALSLETNQHRSVVSAAMNAVLREQGLVARTMHCRNDDIVRCGELMAADLRREFGTTRVGVVGYQPGLVAGLAREFGEGQVRVVDLLTENIGRHRHGVEIWDGLNRTEDLVRWSQLILATGSTVANGTIDALLETAGRAEVPLILYGVTAAAVCHLCGIRRLCFLAA